MDGASLLRGAAVIGVQSGSWSVKHMLTTCKQPGGGRREAEVMMAACGACGFRLESVTGKAVTLCVCVRPTLMWCVCVGDQTVWLQKSVCVVGCVRQGLVGGVEESFTSCFYPSLCIRFLQCCMTCSRNHLIQSHLNMFLYLCYHVIVFH